MDPVNTCYLYYEPFRYSALPDRLAIGVYRETTSQYIVTITQGANGFGRWRELRFRKDNLRPIPYDARVRGWRLLRPASDKREGE